MSEIVAKSRKQKLDFRFADEMDGMDIVQFVNEAYSIEWNPDCGVMCFRKEGYKVETNEVLIILSDWAHFSTLIVVLSVLI